MMASKIVLLYDDYSTGSAREIIVGADQMSPGKLKKTVAFMIDRFGNDYKVWETLKMHGPAIPKERLLEMSFRDGISLESDVLRIEFGKEQNKALPRGAVDLFVLFSEAETRAFTSLPLYNESVREGLPPIALWRLPVLALHAYDWPAWSATEKNLRYARVLSSSPTAVARRFLGEDDFGREYGSKRQPR